MQQRLFARHLRHLILSVPLLAACDNSPPAAPPADLVVVDALIATQNASHDMVTALAVRAGKFVYLGDSAGAQPLIGRSTKVLRLQGQSLWPGLIDSHIHLMEGSLTMDACTAKDAYLPLEKIAPIITDCAARTPGDSWVLVTTVNAAGFKADAKALDALVPTRPLLLWAADGHVGWVNSAGLARAGIDDQTRDPPDGRIDRRAGKATGFLVDDALGLATSKLDKPNEATRQSKLLRALHELAAVGISTFVEANTTAPTIDTYLNLAAKNELHARVTFALHSEGAATDEEFKRLRELRRLAESEPALRANLIKLFEDGVMEFPTQSAGMLAPYIEANGKPGKRRGPIYIEPEPLKAFAQRAAAEGFGLHIHAIGDRAVRVSLDAFAAARAQGSKQSYSLAHVELVDPADLPRFHELDVIASLQLQWAQPDNYSVDAVLPYIGAERQSRLYPARSLIAAGATVAGGSDWDVSTFNPFEAMAVAVSRANPKEPARGTLALDQKLNLAEMLDAYTTHAARLMGRQSEVGSIEVGKPANFIVLDRKLSEASSADEIRATKVVYNFADGRALIAPAPAPASAP